jgi:hypothetical protein
MNFQWTDAISPSMKPDQSKRGVADSEAVAGAAVVLEGAGAAASGVNPAGNSFYCAWAASAETTRTYSRERHESG